MCVPSSIFHTPKRTSLLPFLKRPFTVLPIKKKGCYAMKFSEYVPKAISTEADPKEAKDRLLKNTRLIRLLHSSLGLVTEAGEFADQIKAHIFYGKALDFINLREEVGDLFWYIALFADALDVDLDKVMGRNIAKLAARYPEKFKSEDAINRDLQKERQILEG